MVKSDAKIHLPTSEELPCSDDTPVDSEDQNWIPNFLLFLLEFIGENRPDWDFGADMAIDRITGVSPLVAAVPDGFLSLGDNVPPISIRALVSHTCGGEYGTKKEIYANLEVLDSLGYNPQDWRQDRQQRFELYRPREVAATRSKLESLSGCQKSVWE